MKTFIKQARESHYFAWDAFNLGLITFEDIKRTSKSHFIIKIDTKLFIKRIRKRLNK